MIDTGCKKSVDVIKNILSLLEAKHYRINCGICYCMILGKQVLYFKEKRDISKKQKGTGNWVKGSSNPQCWEAQKGWGQWGVLLNPCVLSTLDHCHDGSITEASCFSLNNLANLTLSDTLPSSTSLECLFMQEFRSKFGWATDSLRMRKSWTDSAKWDWNWVSNHYHTWGVTGGQLFQSTVR